VIYLEEVLLVHTIYNWYTFSSNKVDYNFLNGDAPNFAKNTIGRTVEPTLSSIHNCYSYAVTCQAMSLSLLIFASFA